MKKFLLATLLTIFAFNQTKAQFNSLVNCGANGIGHSTFFINPDTGYVAGESNGKGVIEKTSNGGVSWGNSYTSTISLQWVEDIFFTGPLNGVAVGVNGTILSTLNGGTTWSGQNIPNVTRFNTVHFPSPSIGYAAGVANPNGPAIYKTIDGGLNWTAQVSNADSSLRSIFFLNVDTGYAFGNYDITKTTNGGATWVKTSNPYPNTDTDSEHLEMFCTDANTCYVPGAPMQKTSNGGATWSPLTFPAISAPYLYYMTSINFTNATTGVAVGAIVDTSNFTLTGVILKTTDAGQTWANINTTANNSALVQNSLSTVKFVNAQVGYIAGANGVALKTTNAGGLTSIASANKKINDINIFPNPANGNFTIQTSSNEKQNISVFDVNGKLVLLQTINGNTNIDASNFNAGVYNISITSNEGVTNKRVVIIR